MAEFRIAIDIGHLIPPNAAVTADVFPNLAYAVRRIAEQAQQQWMAYASGAPLPNGAVIHSRSGAYLRSIQLREMGPFSAEVFSELPYADGIERGMPARDLKRMLDTSLKVRISKDGKRYLIIPFRRGTPGAVGFGKNVMPPAVHDLWRDPTAALKPSRVTGMGSRVSGTGAYDVRTKSLYLVPQRQYQWGDRITKPMLHAAGVHGQAAKRMAGMVQMQNPSGQGGGKHSQYLTFRVMSETSNGWLVPAQPGKWPAKTVAEQLQPIAEKAMSAAVERDIQRYLGATV